MPGNGQAALAVLLCLLLLGEEGVLSVGHGVVVLFWLDSKLALKCVLLSCQDSALACAKHFLGMIQPPRAKKGWRCFLQFWLMNNRDETLRTQTSTKWPYWDVWGNVDTVSSQGWWGCLHLCQGQSVLHLSVEWAPVTPTVLCKSQYQVNPALQSTQAANVWAQVQVRPVVAFCWMW